MPRSSPYQGDFSAGEFSSLLLGQIQAPKYKQGLGLQQNMISMLQGPSTSRAGNVYVSAAKSSTNFTRLIPFKFSNLQAYQLEFGDKYIRFYTQHAQINTGSPLEIVSPYASSDLSLLTFKQTLDVIYLYHPSYQTQKLIRLSNISWSLQAVTFQDGPYLGIQEPSGKLTTATIQANPGCMSLLFTKEATGLSGDGQYVLAYVNNLGGITGCVANGAGGIRITTAKTNNLNTGDHIIVASVAGTTEANGHWVITKASPNTYDLNGSTFTNAYISGGTVLLDIFVPTDVGRIIRVLIGTVWYWGGISAYDDAFMRVQMSPDPGIAGSPTTLDGWQLGLNGPVNFTETLFAVNISSTQTYAGDIYSNNGSNFRLLINQKTSFTTLYAAGTGLPTASGTLTKVQGSGPSTITFTAYALNTGPNNSPIFTQVASAVNGQGWPGCSVFHEGRLYISGSPGALQRVDGSNVDQYENFAPTEFATGSTTDNTVVGDSDAVSFTLDSDDANATVWMTSDEKGMPIGTGGGPWILKPSILNEAITPTNVVARKANAIGSYTTQAVYANKASIYADVSTRVVRELSYFYDIDGFRSINLSELAEHLPGPGVTTELAYQSAPIPIVWMGRADGTLLGMTYDRQIDNIRCGWHRHYLGGVGDSSGNPPIVKSISVIPSPDGTCDDVWMVVQRYINGAQVQYIEYMSRIFQSFDLVQNAFFLDCGATFDNPINIQAVTNANPCSVQANGHGLTTGNQVRMQNIVGLNTTSTSGVSGINNKLFTVIVTDSNNFTINGLDSTSFTPYIANGVVRKQVTTISGLTWLENTSVTVLADGATQGPFTVGAAGANPITQPATSGVLYLSHPAGTVQIGIPYTRRIQLLPYDVGSQDGTSIGKYRRIEQVAMRLQQSGSFKIGLDFDPAKMLDVNLRDESNPLDAGVPLFTGIKDQIGLPSDYDLYNQICIEMDDPLPFTLCAVMPQQTAYDKGP